MSDSTDAASTAELPITSSPLSQAQALWQHFVTSPPPGTTIHPAIHLSSSNTTGLGLSVSSNVPPQTALLCLPRSCHLRPDSGSAIASSLSADDPFLSLCLTLLYERANHSQSAQKAHIDALPTHFDLPLTWSASQLSHLSSTSLALRPPIAELATDWTLHIQPFLAAHPSYPRISPVDQQWAVCCVLSRGFRDREGQPCMVPLLDYCNTEVAGGGKRASCYIGWDEAGNVQLLSGESGLEAGEEVTIVYGEERGNGSLLQRYGFVVEGNEDDTCDMDVQQLAAIARDMGAAPQHPVKHRKTEQPAETTAANGHGTASTTTEENEDDDGIDEFIDQLPEEFIPLTMPPPYPSPATLSPLPVRLLKLVAALLSYYPIEQLIAHTDVQPFTQSLPLRPRRPTTTAKAAAEGC